LIRRSQIQVPQTRSAFHPKARFARLSRDQTPRELVYRPLQFHEGSQLFLAADDEFLVWRHGDFEKSRILELSHWLSIFGFAPLTPALLRLGPGVRSALGPLAQRSRFPKTLRRKAALIPRAFIWSTSD